MAASDMSDQARGQGSYGSPDGAVGRWIGAEGDEQYKRIMSSGNGRVAPGARPQEFDANGFPVRQHAPSFFERVAKLVNPL
jgi:hypothetical protein